MSCKTVLEFGQRSLLDGPNPFNYKSASGTGTKTIPYPEQIIQGPYSHVNRTCIPNFHQRRRNGELLGHNAFERISYDEDVMNGGYLHYKFNNGTYYGIITNYQYLPNSDSEFTNWYVSDGDLRSYLDPKQAQYQLQRAAAKIQTTGHDTLTFLAELSKLRRSFSNLLKNLLNAQLPKGVKSYSSAWLEWRYTWRTLLYDIQDIQQGLENLSAEYQRMSENTGTRHVMSKSYIAQLNRTLPTTALAETVYYQDDIEVGYRGSMTVDIRPGTFHFNPVITAWELVPFSFIVDWFVNVGQALAALSFIGFEHRYASSIGEYVKITRTCTASCVVKPEWVGYNQIISYTPPTSRSTATFKRRTPMTVPQVPLISVRLDEWKILDLLALLVQKL